MIPSTLDIPSISEGTLKKSSTVGKNKYAELF